MHRMYAHPRAPETKNVERCFTLATSYADASGTERKPEVLANITEMYRSLSPDDQEYFTSKVYRAAHIQLRELAEDYTKKVVKLPYKKSDKVLCGAIIFAFLCKILEETTRGATRESFLTERGCAPIDELFLKGFALTMVVVFGAMIGGMVESCNTERRAKYQRHMFPWDYAMREYEPAKNSPWLEVMRATFDPSATELDPQEKHRRYAVVANDFCTIQ